MKKVFFFAVIAILISSISFTSCNKRGKDIVVEKQPNEYQKKLSNTFYEYATMQDVFKSTDIITLQNAIENEDSVVLVNEMINLAGKIHFFLNANYDTFTANVEDYKEVILMGMAYIEFEREDLGIVVHDDLDCILAGVSGILGINDIASLVNAYKNGVSASTLLKTAKVMLKRVSGAFTVALAIWGMGECFGWW